MFSGMFVHLTIINTQIILYTHLYLRYILSKFTSSEIKISYTKPNTMSLVILCTLATLSFTYIIHTNNKYTTDIKSFIGM